MNRYRVYIAQSDTGYTKIGMTSSVDRRMRELNRGLDKVSLITALDCANEKSARATESLLHKRYADYRVNGEWYSIDPVSIVEDVAWVIKLASAMLGIKDRLVERTKPK